MIGPFRFDESQVKRFDLLSSFDSGSKRSELVDVVSVSKARSRSLFFGNALTKPKGQDYD